MNLTPLILMNLILFTITLLLAIADKLLVTYGECKITIEQDEEKKVFKVQGGLYLLSYLIENKIPISASCGGKATCGYCKIRVTNGGGPILPTEEIFMSREEKLEGMRLACQVKVKNDIEIFIPDFLTTVKGIVENELYDPKLKWDFSITEQKEEIPQISKVELTHEDQIKTEKIIKEFKDVEGSIVPLLQKINDAYKYLPEPALRFVSESMNIPLSTVLRIATFYNAFSLKKQGKHIITVCLGTACHVKGAGDILSVFENELGIRSGETTEDMHFTLSAVRCIGCCGLAPVLKVNEDIHGLMTKKKVGELIKTYKER